MPPVPLAMLNLYRLPTPVTRTQVPAPSLYASHTACSSTSQAAKLTVTLPPPPDELTVTVSVKLVPVGAAGLNDPVTPAGALPRLNVTAPVKFVRVMVTVVGALAPWAIVSVAGARESV